MRMHSFKCALYYRSPPAPRRTRRLLAFHRPRVRRYEKGAFGQKLVETSVFHAAALEFGGAFLCASSNPCDYHRA